MALEDKDIFMAICGRFADQPIEFIMEQYEKARRLNMEIEKRSCDTAEQMGGTPEEKAAVEEAAEEAALVPKKRYTKRSLKIKPQDAITDDAIYCCICGEKRQSLTSTHLRAHDITVEDYKKLCGYPPSQTLMSLRRLDKSKEIIRRAQKVRLDRRKTNSDD